MKYTRTQILYHWATVALLAAMAATGLAYRFELSGKSTLVVHQIMGQVLIILLAFRILTRLSRSVPKPGPRHSAGEEALASITHAALYLCLIAFAASGYVSASALRTPALIFPVDQAFARSDIGETILELHYALKWVLAGLVTLHVAGALKHAIWDRDATLSQMFFSSK